ncbi:MAG: inositol monophosphatase [Myxococcota bacterium]
MLDDARWRSLIEAVVSAGDAARAQQRHHLQGVSNAESKNDASPVTEADRATERALRAAVSTLWPDAHLIGEEYGGEIHEKGLAFIIDPIDGTRAFIRDLPTWSVLVGVMLDGELVGGIAYLPTDGDLFEARQGRGATDNGRPCTLSTTATLDKSLVCVGGLRQFDGWEKELLAIKDASYTVRAFADFANYRELLRGRVDAVVDPGLKLWDVAPAAVLVREAGGRVSDFAGGASHHGNFVLSNGRVHDEMLRVLSGASKAP